jgi:hypothetical protein
VTIDPHGSLTGTLSQLGGETVALYVSSGSDTMPFTFLHPRFLASRGMPDVAAPDTFIFVDRTARPGKLAFEDGEVHIETVDIASCEVAGLRGAMLTVRLRAREAGWERDARVLRLQASNEDVYGLAADERWTPEMFIGVCDGCRMGGNDGCENSLDLQRSPLRWLEPPRWWVTEHFYPLGGHVGVGDTVWSRDPAFPVVFRKVGLLSPRWGTYRATLFGATVFSVEAIEWDDTGHISRPIGG